jgi:prepilin-type N-terminal cleavage/methylation domain-containing protein
MIKKSKLVSGFTLIELLIVIAIIGIITSIVLVQLNSARVKGYDAGIKGNLNTIRSEAAIYFEVNNYSYGTATYTGVCPATVQVNNIFSNVTIINALNTALLNGGNSTHCVVNANSYAIAVGMKTGNQAWCIDNTGVARLKTGVATPNLAITNSACN